MWMIITMAAPEYYACIAVRDWIFANCYLTRLNALPHNRHPLRGWTLSHAFFADMGGFAIRADTEGRKGALVHLTAGALVDFMLLENCDLTPITTEDETKDRSKSDYFAKSLVAIQIIYFCSNCITRLAL